MEHIVTISHQGTPAFVPATLNIAVGDTVVWDNPGGMLHTATSTEATTQFDTGDIPGGERSDPISFDTAGENAYECIYHGFMQGNIVVN